MSIFQEVHLPRAPSEPETSHVGKGRLGGHGAMMRPDFKDDYIFLFPLLGC